MLPVIALVGRPNVGKSTLFNVLTGTRDAIVADVPGLTRDRQYGFGRIGPIPYVVIDTGGLLEHPRGTEAQMRAQTEGAVAREGPVPGGGPAPPGKAADARAQQERRARRRCRRRGVPRARPGRAVRDLREPCARLRRAHGTGAVRTGGAGAR